MSKFLLASDYDGTLCQNGRISEEVIKAINEFRQKGNLFGIVTGRDYLIGFEYFKKLNQFPFDFVIANSGAAAYDQAGNVYFAETQNGKIPFGESTLAEELVRDLFQFTSNPCGISFDKTRYDFHPKYPLGANIGVAQYRAFSMLGNVEAFVLANAICDSVERAAEVTDVLKKKFGCYLNPVQNDRCIDISAAGVDKATGILRLADCLGIARENIWTAGDNFNDRSMLEQFHGCAMTTGVKEVKEVSEYVCDSVADVIEMILAK